MRYFQATVAYEPVSPEKNNTQKELTLFCCDDIFPAVSELRKVFQEHYSDKKFVHAWWREIRLSEIPVTELIHPLCIIRTSQAVNPVLSYLEQTESNTSLQ